MATDVQIGVHYDTPIQGGNEPVTRQKGLPPQQAMGVDPQPPPPIIQGDPTMVVVRNQGPHVGGRFASDGTFHADARADEGILYVDHALSDPEAMPPGIERAAMPPRTVGFGNMLAVEQREAAKQAAIAAGFIVLDAPAAPPAAEQSPAIEFKRGGEFVIASDQPGAGDPRDMSTGPQVISSLPTIKKREIVPVTVSVAPAPKAKKGGRK